MSTPAPWIAAIGVMGAAVGVGVGVGVGDGGVADPLFCGVAVLEKVKSAALSSVSAPPVRLSEPGVVFEPG